MMPAADERQARVGLSFLAEPGDQVLGALLGMVDAAAVARALATPGDPLRGLPEECRGVAGVGRALTRWQGRLYDGGAVPTVERIRLWEDQGYRLICPGEPEWPTQVEDLRDARPIVLWVRGAMDLRNACLRSVAVVGSRAVSSYGAHVATELAADLAGGGVTVVSGGAYGIDACAHRGGLAVRGCTVAVLASGLTFGYPKGHYELFQAIAQSGVVVSEHPPDRAPTRPGFLVRNRLIAALTRGTVVVEAAVRSGALNTAKHARELNRPVMAVPGPVTSAQSAGCHQLIRDWDAICVTSGQEVEEVIHQLGDDEALSDGTAIPSGQLDPVTASVLHHLSSRTGRGPATVATLAGVDLDTALRCLGLLAAAGHAERCDQGWRLRRAKDPGRRAS